LRTALRIFEFLGWLAFVAAGSALAWTLWNEAMDKLAHG
jgi:hypothetical protein